MFDFAQNLDRCNDFFRDFVLKLYLITKYELQTLLIGFVRFLFISNCQIGVALDIAMLFENRKKGEFVR